MDQYFSNIQIIFIYWTNLNHTL